QARRGGDDAVPVGVRIVGKGDAILMPEAHEPRHRVRTRRIHADLAVVVDRHEREGRVDGRVRDHDVQVINGVDRLPVQLRGAHTGLAAPPTGSTPRLLASLRMMSRSMTFLRSWTYGSTKSSWCVVSALIATAKDTRFMPAPARSSSLARPSIQCGTWVSAGPPWGGLYLNPPSAGGLCEGVMTMPSARCS